MIVRYQVLSQRISLEMEQLEKAVKTVQRHWGKAKTSGADQDAFINSTALNLHGFYSGLERIFGLIAAEIDGGIVGGDQWHANLLKQVSLGVDDIRPPVIPIEIAEQLDEFRKFRHLIRNIYATNLDPKRMELLVQNLAAVWSDVESKLRDFQIFLKEISKSDEDL